MPTEPRKRPAHHPPLEHGNRTVIVFLTVCSKHRIPVFANHAVHVLLRTWWKRADHWLVGRYVILPGHIHLFCTPGIWPAGSLRGWVAYWKNGVSREWPRRAALGASSAIWQRDFWDTQMRVGESYSAKWEYVRGNPVRHGLVADADAWRFQGVINHLPWHDA